jgi:CHAT domain-containing protein/tetratricopeptide (TPR) repeat protein
MHLQFLNLIRCGLTAVLVLLAVQSGQSGRHRLAPPNHSFIGLLQHLDTLRDSVHNAQFQSVLRTAPETLKAVRQFARPDLEIRVLLYLGSAQLGNSDYVAALRTLLPAHDLATKYHDFTHLYAIDSNISWVYLEMNDLESAGNFSDQALAAERAAHDYDVRPVISRAFIFALNQDFPHAEALFSEAITYALDHDDISSAASGWYLLGSGYVEAARDASPEARTRFLQKALPAATEAFRLRQTHHLSGLDESLRDLGCIYAGLGDLHSAGVLMDRAVNLMGDPTSTAPLWYFYFWRGWLRSQQGDLARALPDLRSALESARRTDVVPTDDDRVTFESGLAELYSLFIDTGNRLYLQNHNSALKAEIFEASEESRAASLRALVPQPNGWRSRLPVEYALGLSKLQSAERDLLSRPGDEAEREVRTLRASLHNYEVHAGAEQETGRVSALAAARRALTPDTAILTFHLGPHASWLWVISSDQFEVYPLPAKSEIAAAAHRVIQLVHENPAALDQRLADTLFGQLPAAVQSRKRWIIALDQDLFSLPLAALRSHGQFLAEQHSILVTPGVRFLKPAGSDTEVSGPLLGVGDAVYNRADPRWPRGTLFARFSALGDRFRNRQPARPWRLARLSGSGEEVEAALAIWGSGATLTGPSATREGLRRTLDATTGILHLATHVIPAPQLSASTCPRPTVNSSRAGLIVLGLNGAGEPGLLDMRDILLRPVNLHLVVMSGCASGDASAPAASGLMGLTRAWLGAGASGVLATRWPVLDDSGPFFSSFYRHLKANPASGAADALREAQVEMIHSHSYRNRPEYWASYFLIGKV